MSYATDTRRHATMAHVVPIRVLLAVFALLLALTCLTVAATGYDLGSWSLVVAIAIATVKATAVALYFMHLRYDQPFYALVFITGVVFLAIFISLTLYDTVQYQGDVRSLQETQEGLGARD